ncbi:MAG: class I SAM-dependent methyltransferase [Bdellovibrionota bacterium]
MISRIALWTYRVTDRAVDLTLGWETWRQVPVPNLGVTGISRIQGKKYQATPYLVLRRVFSEILAESGFLPGDSVLADLGCGKGRVLDFALTRGFGKVLGLEHSEALAQAAVDNLERKRSRDPTRFEVLYGDAGAWDIPDEVNVVFMFNPFGRGVMQNIVGRRVPNPNRRWIYVNPLHLDVMIASKLELELWRGDLNDNYAYAILRG